MSYLQPLSKHENTHRNTVFRERTPRTQVPTLPLTLYDMRVVLQEEVVQVFGDEGRHAGICQCCKNKKKPQGCQTLETQRVIRGLLLNSF